MDVLARARGMLTPAEVANFRTRLAPLRNPFPGIPGTPAAMARIRQAIERQERVVVLGDYDAQALHFLARVLSRQQTISSGLPIARARGQRQSKVPIVGR